MTLFQIPLLGIVLLLSATVSSPAYAEDSPSDVCQKMGFAFQEAATYKKCVSYVMASRAMRSSLVGGTMCSARVADRNRVSKFRAGFVEWDSLGCYANGAQNKGACEKWFTAQKFVAGIPSCPEVKPRGNTNYVPDGRNDGKVTGARSGQVNTKPR